MTNPRFYSTSEIIADRLRHSSNPVERRSLYAGRTFHQGFPVLLDTDYLASTCTSLARREAVRHRWQ